MNCPSKMIPIRSRRCYFPALCLAVVLGVYTQSRAYGQTTWKGKTVVLTSTSTAMYNLPRGARRSIGSANASSYKVLDQDGLYIKVRQGSRVGWIRKSSTKLPEQAITYFTSRLQRSRTNYRYLMRRGSAYRLLKKYDLALKDYTAAIGYNPRFATLYNDRAIVWSAKKDYDKAIADYTQAIRLTPSTINYSNRGHVWRYKKLYDKALADYDKSIQLDANNPVPYRYRGGIRRMKKQFSKALSDLNKSIQINPSYSGAFYDRGLVWLEQKSYDKALRDFDQAIRLSPKYTRALCRRGTVWTLKKSYARALGDFSQALKISPKDTVALNSMAWLLATCPDKKYRDGKRAIKLARQVCKSSKYRNAVYIDTLAAALAEAGQFSDAVWWQKKVVKSRQYRGAALDQARQRLRLYASKKAYVKK